MEIASIRAWPLSAKLGAVSWVANTPIATTNLIMMRVETDQGVTGLPPLHGASGNPDLRGFDRSAFLRDQKARLMRAIAECARYDIPCFEEPLCGYDSVCGLGKFAQRTHVAIARGPMLTGDSACPLNRLIQ